ncbi:MAG: tetratricopeptide repeat-containing sensor histidine kinase [Lutibacter sp.]|uniref:ATP-binding protein n=1 Tax=Lutibacter sp. TaxID=1925666 RepID=UPI00385D7254
MNSERKVFLFFLYFLFSFVALSQDVTNFKEQLNSEISDTAKVTINIKLADLYVEKGSDSSFYYNNQALELAKKIDSKQQIAYSLYSLAILYDSNNNSMEAIKYYTDAMLLYEQLNNKLYLAKINRNIGTCFIEIYKEDRGLEYFLKSLSLFKDIENKLGIADIYMKIGDLYYNEENYGFAINYINDALSIYTELNNLSGIANCYTNIGNSKADSGNFDEGLSLYKKSIAIQKKSNNTYGLAINYNNIGDCYLQLKKYKKAEEYLFKSLNLAKELGEDNLEAVTLLNISNSENKLKNFKSAIFYANKSLKISKKLGSLEYKLENLENLSFAYENLGNINKSFDYLKKVEKVKDSISENDKLKKVQLFQALNKLESSQFKIEELSNKNKITELKYKTERKFIYFLVGSIVLFGFFVVLLILQQTAKKNAYNLLAYKNHQINKMNEEIQIQRDDLKQTNKTKDTFFSIIAHDLKNPFNSIIGFTELMIENSHEYSEEKKIKFLKIIKGSTSKASSLLNNLLIWANSQSGNLEFNPQKIDLSQKVSDVISLLEIQAINKDIKISNNINNQIFVNADKNMLGTILRNLLSNAIKFTKTEGLIQVSSKEDLNFVEITVKDNGVGISKFDIENLFSIDVKSSSIGTENEQGSGLGLILCKDFVEKHGGKLWVESNIGEGSEFKFTLPIFSVI